MALPAEGPDPGVELDLEGGAEALPITKGTRSTTFGKIGTPAAGSGVAMTSRSSTCRDAGAPRQPGGREAARPARATATFSRMPRSGGVLRA